MQKLNIKVSARKIFKIIKWVFFVLLAGFIVLTIFRTFHYFDVEKTNDQILKVHGMKITLADVMGDNLPTDPGDQADITIEGIDSNNNNIRDDVEIAIFKEYPNSAKTRAVLLQYALALQMEATQPFVNEELATEVIREQSRGFACVGSIFTNRDSDDSYNKLLSLVSFVEDIQFNTKTRKNNQEKFIDKVRSFSSLDKICDIDFSTLLN